MTITKIPATLDQNSADKLSAKSYSASYTDIPQRVLPTEYKNATEVVFKALVGREMSDSDTTWTVYCKDGQSMSSILGPSISLNENEDLVLRWGKSVTPVLIEDGALKFSNAPKAKVKITPVKTNKWDNVGVTVTIKEGKDSFIMPIVIRVADLKNSPEAEILELTLENGDIAAFKAFLSKSGTPNGVELNGPVIKLGRIPQGEYTITAARKLESEYTPYLVQTTAISDFTAVISKKVEEEWVEERIEVKEGSEFIIKPNDTLASVLNTHYDHDNDQLSASFKFNVDLSMREVTLNGPVIKIAECPIGEYLITGYRKTRSEYTPYLAQAISPEEFEAPSARKVDGEWVEEQVTVEEGQEFIFKPNSSLKKALAAHPLVSETDPGVVEIVEHGEWNGWKTAKLQITFQEYSTVDTEINLNF